MDNFLKYWPVLVVASAGLVGWGTQQTDIEHLKEQAMEQRAAYERYQDAMLQQSAIDERTRNLVEDMKEQKTILIQILQRVNTQ